MKNETCPKCGYVHMEGCKCGNCGYNYKREDAKRTPDMTITTTNGEQFTKAQHAEMANMLYVRFGRDVTQATAAWRRMLQNGTTEQEFRQLLLEVPDTPALDLLEELLSITEQHTKLLDFNDYDKWQRISAKCADLRDGNA